jgi:hypothetical protein
VVLYKVGDLPRNSYKNSNFENPSPGPYDLALTTPRQKVILETYYVYTPTVICETIDFLKLQIKFTS